MDKRATPSRVRAVVLPSESKALARLFWTGVMLALCGLAARAGEGDAPKVFDEDSGSDSLEDRLKKAYEEFQKKSAQEELNSAKSAAQKDRQADREKRKDKKSKEDAEYKSQLAENLAGIKEQFAQAEAKFEEKRYREAASFYASVILANVPKTEQLREDARKRFVEMENLAAEHLNNADDADLRRDFVREVEELSIVVKEFPFTKSYAVAHRRLVGLKTRPDVAGTVELVEAEALEAGGDLLGALRHYRSIAENARYEGSLAAMKAKRKVALLEKDPSTREAIDTALQAEADKHAPALFTSAKNFLANNMPARAKEKLRSIVERFPGTEHAAEAERQLSALP